MCECCLGYFLVVRAMFLFVWKLKVGGVLLYRAPCGTTVGSYFISSCRKWCPVQLATYDYTRHSPTLSTKVKCWEVLTAKLPINHVLIGSGQKAGMWVRRPPVSCLSVLWAVSFLKIQVCWKSRVYEGSFLHRMYSISMSKTTCGLHAHIIGIAVLFSDIPEQQTLVSSKHHVNQFFALYKQPSISSPSLRLSQPPCGEA